MEIRYIQPYSSAKEIGKEYNKCIGELPDDCWVCLLDHDMMFLRHDAKAQIEQILHWNEVNESSYAVLGPVTNRLAGAHQLFKGKFSSDDGIFNHMSIADYCFDTAYGTVKETHINIAGVCMLFKKSTWKEVGGFNEHSISLDADFTDAIKRKGGKLGIMKGVYVFHAYRLTSKDPINDIKHLIKPERKRIKPTRWT